MRRIIALAVFVLLATARADAGELSLRQESGVRTWFRQNRIDLEHLDFSFDRIVTEPNGRRWICGTVRARNRFVHYAGQQHFAALLNDEDRTVIVWTGEYASEEWETRIAPLCGR